MEVDNNYGGKRSRAGCKGLQHIKDEQGNPIPVKDFCFLVLDEERPLIRAAINAERSVKGWMLVRQKAADDPFVVLQRKRQDDESKPKRVTGRKSSGFKRFVLRLTVAERKIVMDTVNEYRKDKGIPLMRLQPGTDKYLTPKKEREAVE